MVTQFGWSKACPNPSFNMMYQQYQSGALPKHIAGTLIQARASNMDKDGLLCTSQCRQTSAWLYQYNIFPPQLEGSNPVLPRRPELRKHIPLCSLGSKLPEEEISHLPQICSAFLSHTHPPSTLPSCEVKEEHLPTLPSTLPPLTLPAIGHQEHHSQFLCRWSSLFLS